MGRGVPEAQLVQSNRPPSGEGYFLRGVSYNVQRMKTVERIVLKLLTLRFILTVVLGTALVAAWFLHCLFR